MRDTVVRAGRGLMWLLRQASGEAKWDEYLERCARTATVPVSRREFEQHRARHREEHPQSRCC